MWTALMMVIMFTSAISVLADDKLGGFEPTKESVVECDREIWGDWIDADKDGEDTRQEVLIAESLDRVSRDDNGKVKEGLWIGRYTGFVTTDPKDLEVDHMVPICEAHESGAHDWSEEKRKRYFNSLEYDDHLIAVWSSANASKGKRDPAEWLPPNRAYWCEYLDDWVAIKRKWGLSMDQEEHAAVVRGREVCGKYRLRDKIDGLH